MLRVDRQYAEWRIAPIREWFRDYKMAEGKKQNEYSFGGAFLSREKGELIALQAHLSWLKLMTHKLKGRSGKGGLSEEL